MEKEIFPVRYNFQVTVDRNITIFNSFHYIPKFISWNDNFLN